MTTCWTRWRRESLHRGSYQAVSSAQGLLAGSTVGICRTVLKMWLGDKTETNAAVTKLKQK